jgi:predicted DNA-binding transcriptional regulator AlpA
MIDTQNYSTVQVAKLVGISPDTLYRWISEKKFYVPSVQSVGRLRVRFWTKEEINEVVKYKAEHYCEKPGRPTKLRKTKKKVTGRAGA